MEYSVSISDGLPHPLDGVNSDRRSLGNDARNHIKESNFINGSASVEYGGEAPWTHVWNGTIKPKEMPSNWIETDTFENRVKTIITNIMNYFGHSCTPTNTTADDFEWSVWVNSKDNPMLADDVYSIQIVWEPCEE